MSANIVPSPNREEMIDTAVKFLENPKVVNTPLAQKQQFLHRKGLTNDEIQQACEKSGAYAIHEQQTKEIPSYPPPLSHTIVPYNSYGQAGQGQLSLFYKIRDFVHNIAIFSIVAYVIHKFYETYIAPFLFGKKKKCVEDSIENLEKNMESSVKDLKTSLENVKEEVERINKSVEVGPRQLVELKYEISTVKGLLLGRKQFPNAPNSPVVPPSIPAWQMSSVSDHEVDDDAPDGRQEESKEDMLDVISGDGSSEPEHGMKTSESSLEIIYSPRDCDSESCHSKKSCKEEEKD